MHAYICVCVHTCVYVHFAINPPPPPPPSIELASPALTPSVEMLPTLMHKYKYLIFRTVIHYL